MLTNNKPSFISFIIQVFIPKKIKHRLWMLELGGGQPFTNYQEGKNSWPKLGKRAPLGAQRAEVPFSC